MHKLQVTTQRDKDKTIAAERRLPTRKGGAGGGPRTLPWEKLLPFESSGIRIGGLISGSSSSPGCKPLARRWLMSSRSGISIETSAKRERVFVPGSPQCHHRPLESAPLTPRACTEAVSRGAFRLPGVAPGPWTWKKPEWKTGDSEKVTGLPTAQEQTQGCKLESGEQWGAGTFCDTVARWATSFSFLTRRCDLKHTDTALTWRHGKLEPVLGRQRLPEAEAPPPAPRVSAHRARLRFPTAACP